MKKYTLTYRCGHVWVLETARALTKRELMEEIKRAIATDCPRCQMRKEAEENEK